jgi:hypothetical protein
MIFGKQLWSSVEAGDKRLRVAAESSPERISRTGDDNFSILRVLDTVARSLPASRRSSSCVSENSSRSR